MSSVPANVENKNTGIIEKPDYLQDVEKYDLGELKSYMSPPRLKIIQRSTSAPYKPPFNDGDVIIIPNMVKIGDQETEFKMTPIFIYPNFICTNPYQMKATLPFIRDQSFDPNSEIAKKARAFIKEPCPENGQYQIQYKQVLNFIVIIHDHPDIHNTPIAIPFNSSGFKVGQQLLGFIQDRRDVPPYVCNFSGISKFVQNPKGDHYILSFRNSPDPWVTKDQVQAFKLLHDNVKKLFEDRRLVVDLDDTDVAGNDDPSKESKF